MFEVHKITQPEELQAAFAVRREVFIKEQNVSEEDEFDVFDLTSAHFLAYDQAGNPCGTARWRKTNNGIKLERFAVLKTCRAQGVGALLLQHVLEDITQYPELLGQTIYLHAQATAVDFYQKYDFQKVGDLFYECEIPHYKMEKVSF